MGQVGGENAERALKSFTAIGKVNGCFQCQRQYCLLKDGAEHKVPGEREIENSSQVGPDEATRWKCSQAAGSSLFSLQDFNKIFSTLLGDCIAFYELHKSMIIFNYLQGIPTD